MNQVSGIVFLAGTNFGIPRVLVEVYDVDRDTVPTDIVHSAVPVAAVPWMRSAGYAPAIVVEDQVGEARLGVGIGPVDDRPQADRLGSVLTDATGSFTLQYDDADFRRRNPDEQRPDLVVVVRAPEETGADSDSAILHISRAIRYDAGTTENYLIRIPNKALADAGLSAPTKAPLEVEEPDAVAQKVGLSVTRQIRIGEEVQKIAAERVAAERVRAAEIETAVESRLVERLTGVSESLAERLNFVPPGANVESAMYQALRKSIEGPINNSGPAKGFLVLTDEEAEQFKTPDGTFRDDIAPEELEPFFFGSANKSSRPTFLFREDPVELLRAAQAQPDLFPPSDGVPGPAAGGTARGAADDSNEVPDGGPVPDAAEPPSPETVPEFVGRLLDTMTSPEEAVSVGVKPRPTPGQIQEEIGGLELHSGPADRAAEYDFHNLQIAFDYVWQKAIDEGIIENAKQVSRQLLDLGGDPVGALETGTDPVRALGKELRTVQTAHAAANLTAVFPTQLPAVTGLAATGFAAASGKGIDPSSGGVVFTTGGSTGPKGIPTNPGTSGTVFDNGGAAAQGGQPSAPELLSEIEALLNQRYAFEIFAPGSVNFGVLVTYRQRWTPLTYQVGNLVKTLTLTPKETRKISTKRVVKRDRSVKEMENSLRVRKEESSNTGRDEAEIIAKAEAKTNFSLTAKGSYDIGIADGDSTVVFGKDAATTSSDTKKTFREAVLKAALEYKDEHKLEVETKETYEEEVSESTEITNLNDELSVTHLFYELQRRYKISEHIHRLTPVVLVAMDVPNPSRAAIDALLFTHGWVIERVLLNDQFRRPLEYLRTKIAGDAAALAAMAQNIAMLTAVVQELKKSYTQARTLANQTADLLTAQTVIKAQATAESNEGLWEKASEALTGDSDSAIDVDAARILEDAARERFDRAVAQEKALRSQLDSETATLNAATDAFAKANAEHLNCLMDLGALRLHIKENILYYMQAIWSHTFDDQIFLALHKKKVPRLATQEHTYKLSPVPEPPSSVTTKPGQVTLAVEKNIKLRGDLDPEEDFVTLAEVAQLDRLMGFKGNYLIFPLAQSNALTDFMMTPYVDSELGLRDPDEFGNFTPEEFVAYAHALNEQMQRQLENGEITEEQVQQTIDQLTEQYKRLLSAPRRAEDQIIVPTGSLYVESLPAAQPTLETFKAEHRVMDVKKVQAEVRRLEMENVRYAARILSDERDDPEVEKKIIIDGRPDAIVVPAGDS
jgi:hypothetical protein